MDVFRRPLSTGEVIVRILLALMVLVAAGVLMQSVIVVLIALHSL